MNNSWGVEMFNIKSNIMGEIKSLIQRNHRKHLEIEIIPLLYKFTKEMEEGELKHLLYPSSNNDRYGSWLIRKWSKEEIEKKKLSSEQITLYCWDDMQLHEVNPNDKEEGLNDPSLEWCLWWSRIENAIVEESDISRLEELLILLKCYFVDYP
jgi:hypothetical protein